MGLSVEEADLHAMMAAERNFCLLNVRMRFVLAPELELLLGWMMVDTTFSMPSTKSQEWLDALE